MIFSPELLPKVLDGSKTVTRRRVKPHERDCRYVSGRTYAVQTRRGGRAVARIRVNSVREERFSDLNADEARLEGFTDASEMRMWWVQRYGVEAYDDLVWRIEFEIHEREGFPRQKLVYCESHHAAMSSVLAKDHRVNGALIEDGYRVSQRRY